MSNKYYTIYFDKHIDKNNVSEVECYKFIKPKLRRFNSKAVYVEFGTGIIKCKDAYYANKIYNIPIVVHVTKEGLCDLITGEKIELVGPIKLKPSELLESDVDLIKHSLNNDELSKQSYTESVTELKQIVITYRVYHTELAHLSTLEEGKSEIDGLVTIHMNDGGRQRR